MINPDYEHFQSETEIERFVRSLQIDSNYDYVAAIERKGVALIRHLFARFGKENLACAKTPLITDEGLRHMPNNMLRGKRVLLFDDTAYTGHLLNQRQHYLLTRGAEKADTACLYQYHGSWIEPTWVLYRDLSLADFEMFREELVDYISQSDFFLLDSEHIPVRLRTHLSAEDFVELLRQIDDVLVIPRPSELNRRYLTIQEPQFFDLSSLEFHPGTDCDNIVFKLRAIVSDGAASLVPMVYPAIPINARPENCPLRREEPEACVCSIYDEPDHTDSIFHCQALYASTKLLARTFAMLSTARDFQPEMTIEAVSVENLKALFPEMKVNCFERWVRRTLETELECYKPKTNRSEKHRLIEDEESVISESDIILRKLNECAIQAERTVQTDDFNGYTQEERTALPNSSLVVGDTRQLRFAPSRALDTLIDQAIVGALPIHLAGDADKEERWARGMRLTGEYVRILVRQAL